MAQDHAKSDLPEGRTTRRRGATSRGSRRGLAGIGAAGVVLLAAGTAVTAAAFTDSVEAGLGAVGGAYQIAFVDSAGELVLGGGEPMVIEKVVQGPSGPTGVEVDVVTTTAATGPVSVSLINARGEELPSDPGVPGPGADPFDGAQFRVSVDGEALTGWEWAGEMDPVVIADWETGVARTVEVGVRLTGALANPYYAGRDMVLGVQLDGSTS